MGREIRSTKLANGLTVLTTEIHDAPVATFWVWYRVGGRNEVAGLTGISHWVEHMMFKGTPTLGKGEIFRNVTKNGGTLNGFTWIDYTTYFETLPSDRLDLALRIESDRMVNSIFDPDEVASERTVIISEREGSENYPTYHLGEEVNSLAFKVHPYGQGVIGWKCDLQAMTRDDLYGWYKRHYSPNNAVAVAVGDFQTDDLLKRIEDLFGPIPVGPEVPAVRSVEPAQIGERRVTIRQPGPTCYFEAAYHTPAASHTDTFPLIVLDAVLSGAKAMGMGGREGSLGRSSRLYRALVDTGLASGAGSSFGLTRDPYLFGVSATLRPGIELAKVERVVLDELDRVCQEGVTEDELAKARKQTRAQLVYGSEGVTSQAYWLGDLEMIASHKLFDEILGRVDAVTTDDVRRVAQAYLGEANRTVGWFVPTAEAGAPSVGADGGQAALRPAAYAVPTGAEPSRSSSEPMALRSEREVLPNGIVVLGHESTTSPVAVLRAAFRAGTIFDPPAKSGVATFTARARQRGTASRSFQQINELTDGLGATISVDASTHTAQVTLRCLREDFAQLTELLAELLREPTFPEDQIERLRGEFLTRLKEQATDPGSMADRLFYELAYPEGHPYHTWYLGDEATMLEITRDDLVTFHNQRTKANELVVSFSGALPFAEVVGRIGAVLGDWHSTEEPVSLLVPGVPRPTGYRRRDIVIAGKSQSEIAMGLPSITRKSPDYYPTSFADLVLGGLGLMGRLGDVVRDKLGLAYHVSSSLDATLGPGAWQLHAGVNPRNADAAIAAIRDEIRRIQNEPIKDDELADGKSYLTGVLPLALETNSGIARLLQQIEIYELGLDYLDRYREAIGGLTKLEIQLAAQRHFSADDLVAVVAGPELSAIMPESVKLPD